MDSLPLCRRGIDNGIHCSIIVVLTRKCRPHLGRCVVSEAVPFSMGSFAAQFPLPLAFQFQATDSRLKGIFTSAADRRYRTLAQLRYMGSSSGNPWVYTRLEGRSLTATRHSGSGQSVGTTPERQPSLSSRESEELPRSLGESKSECGLIPPFRRPIVLRVDLKVKYNERHEAKKLGARWDAARQLWYVQDMDNLAPFLRWIPKHLKQPHKGR